MIKSFRSKALEAFATKGETRKLAVQNTARVARILALIEAATRPEDLNLPGYRWHPLGQMAPGRYAMTVTGNYRLTFAWNGTDAVELDLEDYH